MKKATPSKEGRRSLPTPAPRPATRAGVFLPYKEGRQTFLVRERERERGGVLNHRDIEAQRGQGPECCQAFDSLALFSVSLCLRILRDSSSRCWTFLGQEFRMVEQLLQAHPLRHLWQVPDPGWQGPKSVAAAFEHAVHSVDFATLSIRLANHRAIPFSVQPGAMRRPTHRSLSPAIVERRHQAATQLAGDFRMQRFAVIALVGRKPKRTQAACSQLLDQTGRNGQFMNIGWGHHASQHDAICAGDRVPAIATQTMMPPTRILVVTVIADRQRSRIEQARSCLRPELLHQASVHRRDKRLKINTLTTPFHSGFVGHTAWGQYVPAAGAPPAIEFKRLQLLHSHAPWHVMKAEPQPDQGDLSDGIRIRSTAPKKLRPSACDLVHGRIHCVPTLLAVHGQTSWVL